MKIYITLLIKGNYNTIDVFPLLELEEALRFANSIALDNCDYMEDFKELDKEGCLYYAEFSCLGGSVQVVEKEIISYPKTPPIENYPKTINKMSDLDLKEDESVGGSSKAESNDDLEFTNPFAESIE